MRKRFLMIMMMGMFAAASLTGCGDDDVETNERAEKEEDDEEDSEKDREKDGKESLVEAKMRKHKAEDKQASGGKHRLTELIEDDEDYEEINGYVTELMTALVGSWGDEYGNEYPLLIVYEEDIEGYYHYDYYPTDDIDDAMAGVVEVTYEELDDDVLLWYTLYDNDFKEYISFAVSDDMGSDYAELVCEADGSRLVSIAGAAVEPEDEEEEQAAGGDHSHSGDTAGVAFDDFIGTYRNGDCTITIKSCTDDYHEVWVNWGNRGEQIGQHDDLVEMVSQWNYYPYYDEENACLYADRGCYYELEFNDGEMVSGYQLTSDESALFYFDDGYLVWIDRKGGEADADMLFERVE